MTLERIPLNDLRPTADEATVLAAVINNVVERGWYVSGPELEAFEQEFAGYCGANHCVGVANGSDALTLALAALDLAPGSLVATTANAGGYASAAIDRNDLLPIYVDINGLGSMATKHLEYALETEDIAAAILTHLYGNADGAAQVATLCREKGVPLIEDCSQAHGAITPAGRVGTLGAAGCFSFYPTKNLGCIGDGGAVTTSSPTLKDRLKSLRNYGWSSQRYVAESKGINSRLDELQAAVLRTRLASLDARNDRRREIAQHYLDALSDRSLVMGRVAAPHDVFHLFVLNLPDRAKGQAKFDEAGIATEIHYPVPDYRQPRFEHFQRGPAKLENTEAHCTNVLTLPCYPNMEQDQIERVCKVLRTGWR